MERETLNGVAIYNLSHGKALPQLLGDTPERVEEKGKGKLRKKQPIDVIHEMRFPHMPTHIRQTADGSFIFAAGGYPPQVHVYDVEQASMKYNRHVGLSVLQLEMLSPDNSKYAVMQAERWIQFHTPNKMHYRMRLPLEGRDMAYSPASCELFLCGVSSEVHRINLEAGKFDTPLEFDAESANAVRINPLHQLTAAGCSDGTVVCWDRRMRRSALSLNVLQSLIDSDTDPESIGDEISTIEFHYNGIVMGAGTNKGAVALFDLRSTRPSVIKDHHYGEPIKRIQFLRPAMDISAQSSQQLVMSACTKNLRIWEQDTGAMFTCLIPEHPISDFTILKTGHNLFSPYESPHSGLVLMACDSPKMNCYFIPSLGRAPDWCSFLDAFARDDEATNTENTEEIFDNLKFVTPEELESLGISGEERNTKIKPWMHGYLVPSKLYLRAKALLMKVAPSKREREAESKKQRISTATRKRAREDEEEAQLAELEDERFAKMKSDPRFAVKAKNTAAALKREKERLERLKRKLEKTDILDSFEQVKDEAPSKRMFRLKEGQTALPADPVHRLQQARKAKDETRLSLAERVQKERRTRKKAAKIVKKAVEPEDAPEFKRLRREAKLLDKKAKKR
eukprot:TRINITY_DN4450_c0_g1_i1.p1 TRINITY_DN4450_c0_g1~~TRINITY_DN4450_c0_g1_i1.p1  ORF type:complete len:630 (+),score=154.80 TRINITY_DN4450_c0_g1_i1:23-1891(+)